MLNPVTCILVEKVVAELIFRGGGFLAYIDGETQTLDNSWDWLLQQQALTDRGLYIADERKTPPRWYPLILYDYPVRRTAKILTGLAWIDVDLAMLIPARIASLPRMVVC